MWWKDVLRESVLEKEGKSEQEKPNATGGASLQPATEGGGGRQGAAALITPAGRRGQCLCALCQPGYLLLPLSPCQRGCGSRYHHGQLLGQSQRGEKDPAPHLTVPGEQQYRLCT